MMDYNQIAQEKTQARDALKTKFHLPRRPKTLVALMFSDSEMLEHIASGLAILPVNFVIISEKNIDLKDAKNIAQIKKLSDIDTNGIDALLCDCESYKLEDAMKQGIAPIVNEKNYL